MNAPVVPALPPDTVLRVLNPVMRRVLRTPLGRLAGSFALLDFTGRRSGRSYRVPVGWYEVDGRPFVLTPAPWRVNFAGGAEVVVHHRGRAQRMTGTLDSDADEVARLVRALLASGIRDRMVGMEITDGHEVTADDMRHIDRRVVRLEARSP